MGPDFSIVIGIPVSEDASLLGQTLRCLRADAPSAPVVLLPDGAGEEVLAALPEAAGLQQLPGSGRRGNAACFNRLVRSIRAEVYVLLENGAMPAPGCFDRLFSTFARLPRCGITGPSTNRHWNEQCVLSPGGGANQDLEAIARTVERRFGAARRSLRPLHSLGDFCYGVRREVIEAIGEADEDYPAGQWWDMDYNIRAHRAGFLGVWTCGAYVQRAARLEVDSQAQGDATEIRKSKEHYQDKFCGRRLRGEKGSYREHCRGDACPNFAPPRLIQILPATAAQPAQSSLAGCAADDGCVQPTGSESGPPLISCIMPTHNRRAFIPDALACFMAQEYRHLELIVVDDGSDPVADLMPPDPRIRYFRLDRKLNTGAKRNFACEQACGEWIAHWDDDDWYAPGRILRQVKEMTGSRCQVSGTTTMYYVNKDREQAFRYAYRGPGRAWMAALMFTKQTWERVRFEAIQVGEDVRFIGRIPVAARFDLNDPALTIGTIHAGNTSPKVTSSPYWTKEPIDKIRAILSMHVHEPAATAKQPLISCIMPTYNRRPFIALALDCFYAQTYPNKELVVVDDGTDSVADLLKGKPSVSYASLDRRMSLGTKRNLACELAQGELIAHWDDDDWYSPVRLSRQIEPLNDGRCDVTGLVNTHTLEMPAARFWSTSSDLHRRMWLGDVVGGTLMFRKAALQKGIRYPDVNVADDAALLRQLMQNGNRIMRVADPGLFIYLRHGGNTWRFDAGRYGDPRGWSDTAPPEGFHSAVLESYREACRLSSQA